MLAQVRRTEDALRAAPGNATLRMLLWYQVRATLTLAAMPPCTLHGQNKFCADQQVWAARCIAHDSGKAGTELGAR